MLYPLSYEGGDGELSAVGGRPQADPQPEPTDQLADDALRRPPGDDAHGLGAVVGGRDVRVRSSWWCRCRIPVDDDVPDVDVDVPPCSSVGISRVRSRAVRAMVVKSLPGHQHDLTGGERAVLDELGAGAEVALDLVGGLHRAGGVAHLAALDLDGVVASARDVVADRFERLLGLGRLTLDAAAVLDREAHRRAGSRSATVVRSPRWPRHRRRPRAPEAIDDRLRPGLVELEHRGAAVGREPGGGQRPALDRLALELAHALAHRDDLGDLAVVVELDVLLGDADEVVGDERVRERLLGRDLVHHPAHEELLARDAAEVAAGIVDPLDAVAVAEVAGAGERQGLLAVEGLAARLLVMTRPE